MKIPDKLKIGGHIYKIIKVKGQKLKTEEGAFLNREKNEITFDISMPQTQIEENLIHEIFHGLNSTMSHEFLDSLAAQLFQVLKDNDLLK